MLDPYKPHTPPGFQERNKPHICRIGGQFWVVWPHGAVMPEQDELERLWRPFMSMLNDITLPRPTSTLIDSPVMLQ